MLRDPIKDRFLRRRGGILQYRRRVPSNLVDLDDRAPLVRISLKTDDLAKARALRDAYEMADNELWAAMLEDDDIEAARKRYAAAVKRAEALGFRYRPAGDLARDAPWQDVAQRLEAAMISKSHTPTVKAVLGGLEAAPVTLDGALKVYLEEISPPSLLGKSEQQLRKWKVTRSRRRRT